MNIYISIHYTSLIYTIRTISGFVTLSCSNPPIDTSRSIVMCFFSVGISVKWRSETRLSLILRTVLKERKKSFVGFS